MPLTRRYNPRAFELPPLPPCSAPPCSPHSSVSIVQCFNDRLMESPERASIRWSVTGIWNGLKENHDLHIKKSHTHTHTHTWTEHWRHNWVPCFSFNTWFQLSGVEATAWNKNPRRSTEHLLITMDMNVDWEWQARRSDQLRYPIHNRSFVAHGRLWTPNVLHTEGYMPCFWIRLFSNCHEAFKEGAKLFPFWNSWHRQKGASFTSEGAGQRPGNFFLHDDMSCVGSERRTPPAVVAIIVVIL